MKKGFTFAELMICLLVISVVTAVLYPTIAQFTPNANKPLFKSSYKALSVALREIASERLDGELPLCAEKLNSKCAGNVAESAKLLCEAFDSKANSVSQKDKNGKIQKGCVENAGTYELALSNGSRWKFLNYTSVDPASPAGTTVALESPRFVIYVDVNASNNNLAAKSSAVYPTNAPDFIDDEDSSKSLNYGVFFFYDTNTDDGVYKKDDANEFNIERLRVQDTFRIDIDKTGKIIDMSDAAWANLEDTVVPD